MKTKYLGFLLLLGLFLVGSSLPAQAITTLTVSSQQTSGTNGDTISAQVVFDINYYYNFTTRTESTSPGAGYVQVLKVVLTNTSPDPTLLRGNLLTGVLFSVDYTPTLLPNTATAFDGTAQVWATQTSTTTTTTDIAPATTGSGLWMMGNLYADPDDIANDGNNYGAYDYAIATVAYGLGGLSGSRTGGDNYGIATDDAIRTADGLPAAHPIINAYATFWIAKPSALTDLNQIDGVLFAYGSLPDNANIPPPNVIPEPSSALLLGLGLGGLAWFARKRRHH